MKINGQPMDRNRCRSGHGLPQEVSGQWSRGEAEAEQAPRNDVNVGISDGLDLSSIGSSILGAGLSSVAESEGDDSEISAYDPNSGHEESLQETRLASSERRSGLKQDRGEVILTYEDVIELISKLNALSDVLAGEITISDYDCAAVAATRRTNTNDGGG